MGANLKRGRERELTRNDADLVHAISRAIRHVRGGQHDPVAAHETLKRMYSWEDVAERTERVYEECFRVPPVPLVERFSR